MQILSEKYVETKNLSEKYSRLMLDPKLQKIIIEKLGFNQEIDEKLEN